LEGVCLSNNPGLEGDLNQILNGGALNNLKYFYVDGPNMIFPDTVDF
jgi:hypothetical protein